MSGLSKQSIRRLCGPGARGFTPMITPFEPDKVRTYGVSHGLSHASYDATIAHDLVLGRHPGYVIKEWLLDIPIAVSGSKGGGPLGSVGWLGQIKRTVRNLHNLVLSLRDLQQRLRDEPPAYALAYTVEDFCMPANVRGEVCDKSTFARVFVSAYNTFFDPGFHGNATLELVNDSDQRVEYKAGQGVCQFVFTWLDHATESPYDGKYQHQTKAAHGARFEADAGGVDKEGKFLTWAEVAQESGGVANAGDHKIPVMGGGGAEAYVPLPKKPLGDAPWKDQPPACDSPRERYLHYRKMLDCSVGMNDLKSGELAFKSLTSLVRDHDEAKLAHDVYSKLQPTNTLSTEQVIRLLDEAQARLVAKLPELLRHSVQRRG